jgi:hypothetical protein
MSGNIVPKILKLGTRWKGVISFILNHFTSQDGAPGKQMNTRMGKPQSFYGRKEKSSIYVINSKTPWSESASELYRPSDRRLSAK